MKWWEYVYLALVTGVMIYLIYRYIDLSLKIKRQRRRYDLLLRGRGELNIEELLRAHSHDIDLSVKKLKVMEQSIETFDQELKGNKVFLDTKLVDLNNSTNSSLLSRTDKQYSEINRKIEGMHNVLEKRIESNFNKVNSDIKELNGDFNSRLSNLDSSVTNKLNSFDAKYNAKVHDLDEKFNNKVNNIDAKFTNEVDKINTDRAQVYKKINERHEFDVSNLKKLDEENYNKLVEFIKKQDKAIDENLGFAIQQVSLYKYNALKNQTGDLSFTMVLLDRMNNGVMLTSINGRDASYTYSKEVVNGKCLVDISPEEENALKMVIKNN